MEEEIKITAHVDPATPNSCRFEVDRPVYTEGSAYFPSKEKAKDSPLAEELFKIEGVASTKISGNNVTVTTTEFEDWRTGAKKMAETIRAHLRSGKPVVSPDFRSKLISNIDLKNKVQEIFDLQVNPAVAGHGGFVELLDVKNNNIYVRMGGGCQGCGMADVTLRQGIETLVREKLPQIGEILDVTDHAAGGNPYYTPSKK